VHIERSIDIDAPPDRVWAVITDIEGWPDVTPSVSKAELLQPGPLAVGSEARLSQPRFGTRVWRVTALEPGISFTWEATGAGARQVASHTVTPRGDGGSSLELRIESDGWAVTLFGWMLAGTARRYVRMEAEGVKRRAEAAA
jgi:carbon monoxide dehydrogenase subunit G